ncbi:ATP synthase F1 subunit delta [Patescibacteria group bacterium]|nr:ATP synthase F1 subunit delta [Patescibacteria group bacterium]
MKKITAKQYATSLYQAIKEAEGDEQKQKIRNFLEVVKKRKDLKLLKKIFISFTEVYQKEEGILKAEVTFSRDLNSKIKEEVKNWLKDYTGRTATVEEKIDESILGGVIVKFEDTILDASLKNSLKRLQSSLLK